MFEREYKNFLNYQWQLSLTQFEEALESKENVQHYKDLFEQKLYLNETESYCKLNMLNLIDRDEINEIPDTEFTQKATLSKTQERIYEEQQKSIKTLATELQSKLEEFYQLHSTVKNDALEIQTVLQNNKAMEIEIEKIEAKLNSSKCRAASDAEKLSKIQVIQLQQLGTDMMNEETAVFELDQKIMLAEKKDSELRQEFESLQSQYSSLEQSKRNPNHQLEKLDDWYRKGICTLYKLSGIADIKIPETSSVAVTFDISPSFPCLQFKHADVCDGFYITEAKITKTFKEPQHGFLPKPLTTGTNRSPPTNSSSENLSHSESPSDDPALISDPATLALLNCWLDSPDSSQDDPHWLPTFISSVYHHLITTL